MTATLETTDIAAILGRARKHKLNDTALQALCELYRRGDETLGALAILMDLSSAAMTEIADRLERLGYVRRYRVTEDRRCWKLSITPAGESALNHILL